jgi:hypothetical protein
MSLARTRGLLPLLLLARVHTHTAVEPPHGARAAGGQTGSFVCCVTFGPASLRLIRAAPLRLILTAAAARTRQSRSPVLCP